MNKQQFLAIQSLEVQGNRHTIMILCDELNNRSFGDSERGKRFSVQGTVLKHVA